MWTFEFTYHTADSRAAQNEGFPMNATGALNGDVSFDIRVSSLLRVHWSSLGPGRAGACWHLLTNEQMVHSVVPTISSRQRSPPEGRPERLISHIQLFKKDLIVVIDIQ